ncbi:hypothetical protein JX265_006932 [Neoarthrinium moseri]|uniref:CFEM domain-containing protein n=1 Tax=Neoarthrinium moseri TaxID=1658444 RepID=A0A9P9WLD0_9PEZI|nr:hypothetical protein JX265_006932 [Neoarthrinium moseri]
MKTFSILLSNFAALVATQTLPANFPTCGTTCFTGLLAQAGNLGCSATDYSCLCTRPRFLFGVRDCANQACPNAGDAQTVIDYGVAFCANAGVAISDISVSSTASVSVSPTTTVFSSDTASSGATGGGGGGSQSSASQTGSAGGASSTPVSTVAIVGTDSSGSPTTTESSTIYSSVSGGGSGAGSNSATSETGSSTITVSNESTTMTTEVPVSHTSGGSGTSGSGQTSTSSSAFAPQRTVGPAGIIAAVGAGFAVLL